MAAAHRTGFWLLAVAAFASPPIGDAAAASETHRTLGDTEGLADADRPSWASLTQRAFLGLREAVGSPGDASQPLAADVLQRIAAPVFAHSGPNGTAKIPLAGALSRAGESWRWVEGQALALWEAASSPVVLEPVAYNAFRAPRDRRTGRDVHALLALEHQQRPAAGTVIEPQGPVMDPIALTILSVLVHVLLLMVVACFYAHFKPDPMVTWLLPPGVNDKDSLNGDFKHSVFGCCDTPCLSCFTCCCLGVRWADSVRMTGYFSFVVAMLAWVGIEVLGMLLSGVVSWILIGIVGVVFRQRLRKLFGMEKTPWTMFLDCLKWFFCCCCTAIQEARQLEEAKEIGHAARDGTLPLDLRFH